MQEDKDGLLAVLRREPERAQTILKIGFGVPVAIVAWNLAGPLFLPDIAVLALMLFFILAYAGVLTYLIARLVYAADRWQIESALSARRLVMSPTRRMDLPDETNSAASRPSRQSREATPPPVAPAVQSDFHRAYYLLRLTEEVQKARREGREFSLIALDITVPGGDLTPAVVEKVGLEMAGLAASQSKVISLPVAVGPTAFVFLLPHSDGNAAKSFLSKVVQALGDYWCHFGIAVYPKDATEAEELFARALGEVEESHEDRKPLKGRKAMPLEQASYFR